jgi:hypothetical protein
MSSTKPAPVSEFYINGIKLNIFSTTCFFFPTLFGLCIEEGPWRGLAMLSGIVGS